MTRRIALLAASAVLLLSTPAFAGNDRDDNSCKGNCPTTGGGPTTATSSSTGVGVGVGVGIGQGGSASATGGAASATGGSVGDIDVRGGAGGSASSSLGSLNKFGGDGGSVVGSGNSAQGQDQGQLQGQGQQQGQIAASDQTQGQSLTNSNTLGQANSQTVGGQNASTASSSTTTVTVHGDEAQKRAPVSTAMAFGSAGVGAGMCRFGPGAGIQGIAAGASLSLPIFKDYDCVTIAKAELIFKAAGAEAAVQYLSARDAEINKAVALSRR